MKLTLLALLILALAASAADKPVPMTTNPFGKPMPQACSPGTEPCTGPGGSNPPGRTCTVCIYDGNASGRTVCKTQQCAG